MATTSATNQQLELGSTATTYEPYQSQSYEVNLGKNLFGGSIYKENYVITSNGAENPATGGVITTAVQVEPKTTYTASVNWDASTPDKYMRVGIYTSDMTFISRPSSTAEGAPVTFTTPANARYVRLSYFVPATEAQLELGSQATSYAAYFEPIELCKIGTYQDSIYKSGGKWYVRKEVGKAVLDGSEAWETPNNRSYSLYKAYSKISNMSLPLGTLQMLCDYFTPTQSYDAVGSVGTGNSFINFNYDGTSSNLAGFKTWLTNNNISLYAPLATPTDTEITNEALIEQLEAILNSGRVYEGTNNITTVIAAGNAKGEVQVSYYTHQDPSTRDEIIIDSRLRTITLNGLDIYDKKTEGSDFLMLVPGENKLILQSDIEGDNGYAEVNYKQGYLSI
jgi:hypothetical protein